MENDQKSYFLLKKQPVFVSTKYKRTNKTRLINFFVSLRPVKLKKSHKHQELNKNY